MYGLEGFDAAMSELCEYTITLTTELPIEKFRAVVTQNSKTPAQITTIAHDTLRIPQLRILELGFTTPEDRDRVVIALRMATGPATAAKPRSN